MLLLYRKARVFMTKKQTLFEICADLRALENLLEEIGGDISDPEVAEAIDQWLGENSEALETKLDGYAALITERMAMSKARKEEAKRLSDLARADENFAKRLRERLQLHFEEQGIEKTETARFKFSLANNGGRVPVLLDEEFPAEELPAEFQLQRIEADKDAIREALERGEVLEFARLGERGKSLRIR